MSTDTAHRCIAGRDCRDAESVSEGIKVIRVPAATEEPDTLCRGCIRRAQYAIEDLPFYYVALHISLGETSRSGGAKVSSTPVPAIPIDQHRFALMAAISENLDRAAEIVSDALNCDPPTGKVGRRLENAARMVSTNIDKLLASGDVPLWVWERCDSRCGKKGCDAGEHLRISDRDGIQTALALRDLHRRARSTIGEFEKVIRIEAPCGECGAPSLQQNPTTGTVSCKDCGHEWTEELLGLAGRMIKRQQQEQERDMAINEELKARAEWAEWLLAEREWHFSLALECTNATAADFAREVAAWKLKKDAPQSSMAS